MHKKSIYPLLMVAAFVAFAAMPAVASATNDPELTYPTGTLLATGNAIKATNVGETLMTDASTNVLTRCTTATMTGTLTKNDGSNVEGNITSASFSGTGDSGRCTATFGDSIVTPNPATNGLPWCLRSTSTMATDEFQIRGNSCSNLARPIRFALDLPFVGPCTYQRSAAILGTYTTHPGGAFVSISKVEFPLLEGSFACPSAGYLDMTFALELDTTPTADQLYIS